ncbi:MAG: hypothetical protein HY207_04395, partial [Nitrospirae bacterium]|nr:hypothetical protein [Nitrospirota bacterium]
MSVGSSNAVHPLHSDTPDKEELESAREVMRALAKTLKAYKMYLPEHEFRRRFREDLHARFRHHFDRHGDVVLTVKSYEFWYGPVAVYEEPNRFENLAFRCSADGLRELTFQQGLTVEEIEGFIGILSGDARPLDEDVVTRLWEAGFAHILYLVAEATDESGDPSLSTGGVTAPSARRVSGQPEAEGGAAANSGSANDEIIPIGLPDESDAQVYVLSEDEILSLQREVAAEAEEDFVAQLIDILTSMLVLDDDEQSFLEVLNILDEIVVTSLRQGQHHRATEVLKQLLALSGPDSQISDRSRALIRVVWTELGTWERLAPLEEALNQRGAWDGKDLVEYLHLLPPSSVAGLITLLERVQTAKGRRVVCDVLIRLGKDDVDTIVRRLPSAPWYLARNLIYILGCLGDPRALPALDTATRHPEVRIRKEGLRAMEVVGGTRVTEMIPRWLGDPDESVRLLVMKTARKFPSAKSIEALNAMIMEKGFARRSEAEQREVFDTLADIGAEAILPLLRSLIARKRSWPWRS